MEKENLKKEEVIFPKETSWVIKKILEKYDFKKAQEEGLKKFFQARLPARKSEIFKNLPGSKISKLVKDCAEGKISQERLPFFLEKTLNISSKRAKAIAKELKEKILAFIKSPLSRPKKVISPLKSPSQQSPRLPREDIYREPIEE